MKHDELAVEIHDDTPVIHAARLAALAGYLLTYDSVIGRVVLRRPKPVTQGDNVVELPGVASC